MAVAIPGVSTLGIVFSYGIESTSGQKPGSFTALPRCNEIDELALETATIDASALEDYISRYIAGRQDPGGNWNVTFNVTNETIPILKNMMSQAASALAENKRTWFQISSPYLDQAFFVVGQPGSKIPLPAIGQNALFTAAISIAVDEYIELDNKVEATDSMV